VATYLDRLQDGAGPLGISADLRIMQSNGDTTGPQAARERPVDLLFSGPAAGVTGAAYLARLVDLPNAVTFDMGGTSTDVCLVEGGRAVVTNEQTVAGHPVKVPATDVHSVGAGGGSVAWIDAGGSLRVGPRSAGADPGPACYGLGGEDPTVTDANVVLGRLNPTHLLGGQMSIDRTLAERAIATRIAEPLGIGIRAAARGILDVLCSNIVAAIRVITVERGRDPRELTLVAFGGAGPMHAGMLAREMGMPRVLVPQSPGVFCASGLLVADLGTNYSRTLITSCADPDLALISEHYASMEEQGSRWLTREGVARSEQQLTRLADLRYVGQEHGLTLGTPNDRPSRGLVDAVVTDFHAAHERIHGYCLKDAAVEIIAVRLRAHAETRKPATAGTPVAGQGGPSALIGSRAVDFDGEDLTCPVYDRHRLAPGSVVIGPAILEQMDTTTVVLRGQTAELDRHGNIFVQEGTA
jgi:N-methylhydantoinase A